MSFYPEFEQEPSKPHQCVFYNDDGVRCRSYAMRNEYTCYHHQNVDMPHVISNDAFPLELPKDRRVARVAGVVSTATEVGCPGALQLGTWESTRSQTAEKPH